MSPSDPVGKHSNAPHNVWQGCLTILIWTGLILLGIGLVVLL